MDADNPNAPMLVVGAGIMGTGIAQIAAEAGHPVHLYDARAGAAKQALAGLRQTLDTLVAKGKRTPEAADLALRRIAVADELGAGREASLVVEAIVEDLAAKRGLFQALEEIVAPGCVLATNTSSLSVTAIAKELRHPDRFLGMHFFNPVGAMKLVEVISGLATAPGVAQRVFDLAVRWGKTPVHAKSTPGFIVNRIARPFYGESLALLGERALEPALLDQLVRGAGFRMGPCELMDLVGHDTSLAVTRSVYEAMFHDQRYLPSTLQRDMVDAGRLGRKSGRGFFDYAAGTGSPMPALAEARQEAPAAGGAAGVQLGGEGAVHDRLVMGLRESGVAVAAIPADGGVELRCAGVRLRLTEGRPASALGSHIAVFDLPPPRAALPRAPLAFSVAGTAPPHVADVARQCLRWAGFEPVQVPDHPGLVLARIIATLINEASDAVAQGVCAADAADTALKLGLNFPWGPFEWLAHWGAAPVTAMLEQLDHFYRGGRYRVSLALRRQLWQAAAPGL